jgi:glucan biosynthesis protein C
MDLAHRLRMPLLFVIAGAGMWYALQRRTLGAFTRERALRLLVPALAGMLLIVPPQVYVERVVDGEWHGGYFAFLWQRVFQFVPYPLGDFSWHHLWFIIYLFVYVLLLLPLMSWWRRARPVIRPGVWQFALALPLGLNEALLKPLFPEVHNLVGDWYIFNHYLLLTVYGFALATMPGAWDWLAAWRRRSLAVAVTITVSLLTMFETGVIAHDSIADQLLANVFTWTWLLTFLGYGRAHFSFGNRLLEWSRDASYPVYILHQTVIILIAWPVIAQAWSPGVKYWLVLSSTLLICVLAYELVLRRFAWLRVLFGIKPGKAAASGSPEARAVSSRIAAS